MKIIFAAGGTGGHINPALAAAGEIREHESGSRHSSFSTVLWGWS